MIRLPEIKTAELSTYGNFAKCHRALFRVPREGLGTRLGLEDDEGLGGDRGVGEEGGGLRGLERRREG